MKQIKFKKKLQGKSGVILYSDITDRFVKEKECGQRYNKHSNIKSHNKK